MMTKPLLSILIPTVVGREAEYESLVSKLCGQYQGVEVEITTMKDNKEMTIGEKRGKLYQMANGEYSLMIDDDDALADGAMVKILEAIKNNPEVDCITYRERCIIDGVYYPSNFSMEYAKWEDNVDGFAWVRNVFYKAVIKTSIAQSVPFEHIRFGEDEKWAMTLAPHLKTEHHIDEEIYHYIHNSSPSHERYGFDKD